MDFWLSIWFECKCFCDLLELVLECCLALQTFAATLKQKLCITNTRIHLHTYLVFSTRTSWMCWELLSEIDLAWCNFKNIHPQIWNCEIIEVFRKIHFLLSKVTLKMLLDTQCVGQIYRGGSTLFWLSLQTKHLQCTKWYHWFEEICGRKRYEGGRVMYFHTFSLEECKE